MSTSEISSGQRTRAALKHPVIDADGHTIELFPAMLDYITSIGGAEMAERYVRRPEVTRWYRMTAEERLQTRTPALPWWGRPTKNTLDRATATLPRLLHERLDDLGVDYAIIYPSDGLTVIGNPGIQDDELRRICARAVNTYHADLFREFSNRLTPAAVIPMQTPEEAIEELKFVVRELGLKVITIGGGVMRPLPGGGEWWDTFAIDSRYNYDPVWETCLELKVAVSSHGGTMGWGTRALPSSYSYNHIGQFRDSGEALVKALLMGGVTRRFPTLNFSFLEGGAAFGCSVFADLLGHWEKRNARAIQDLDPSKLDVGLFMDLLDRYGYSGARKHAARIGRHMSRPLAHPDVLDDWEACKIATPEELRDLFVPRFYFGCEADDPTNAWAFNTSVNPLGVKLRAMFGSDIGHWDVPDMTQVLPEAHELVEKGLLTTEDFQDFVFGNVVRMHGEVNPDFFKGTHVELEAADFLGSTGAAIE